MTKIILMFHKSIHQSYNIQPQINIWHYSEMTSNAYNGIMNDEKYIYPVCGHYDVRHVGGGDEDDEVPDTLPEIGEIQHTLGTP